MCNFYKFFNLKSSFVRFLLKPRFLPICMAITVLPLIVLAQPRPKIVATNLTDERFEDLKASANAEFIRVADHEEAMLHVADADALFGICSLELIQAGKQLKWIQLYSAGVDNYRYPELRDSNITLTNCKIIQGPEIADHAMALLLGLTRRLNEFIPLRMKHQWGEVGTGAIELNGRTALVIGLGGIGTQIAQRAHAFGMRVLAVDPKDIPYTFFFEKVFKPDQLHDVLPQADVVFMAAPLTDQTEKLIGSKEFGLMKEKSYFIVISRGKTYDGRALAKALKSGHLAGAGLDVTDPEPLPEDDPLWTFDNVIITPHIAGQSDKIWDRRMDVLQENARRFTEDLPLLNIVDKQNWY